MGCLDEEDVAFEDFVACGRRLAQQLRSERGCDVVVALTHMRQPNDLRLARECRDCIDLVLGGQWRATTRRDAFRRLSTRMSFLAA